MLKCSISKFLSISEHYWALISISECFRALLNIVEHCWAFLRIAEMLGWDARLRCSAEMLGWDARLRCSEQFGHSESSKLLDGLGLESLESCWIRFCFFWEVFARSLLATIDSKGNLHRYAPIHSVWLYKQQWEISSTGCSLQFQLFWILMFLISGINSTCSLKISQKTVFF